MILGFFFLSQFFLSPPPQKQKSFIKLMIPKKTQNQMSQKQALNLIQKSQNLYAQDHFLAYFEAQKNLIKILENSSNPDVSASAAALLCLVDLELWPFTQKSELDLKALERISQYSTQISPSNVQAQSCLSVMLILQNQWSQANQIINTVIDREKNSPNPPVAFYYLKARVLIANKEYDKALGYLNEAQKIWSNWWKVFNESAQILQRPEINQAPKATQIYKHILKNNPQHTSSQVYLGTRKQILFKNISKSKAFLSRLLNSQNKVPPQELSQIHFSLAQIFLKEQNKLQALNHAKMAYKIDSTHNQITSFIKKLGGSIKADTQKESEQLILEGDLFLEQKQYLKAQSIYKKAFQIYDKNAQAAIKIAQCLWNLNSARQAFSWLNKAIAIDKKQMDAYILLIDYYSQRYNFKQAGNSLRQARLENKKNYKTVKAEALFELRRRNYLKAQQRTEAAIKMYASDAELYVLLSQSFQGQAEFNKTKYNDAYLAAVQATEINSYFIQAHIDVAVSLAGTRNTQAGVEYISRLIKTNPQIIEYEIALGHLFFKSGQFEKAQEIFRKIIQTHPQLKQIYIQQALTLKALKKTKEAQNHFLKAIRLNPSDAKAFYEMGIIYLENKQPQKALIQFERALKANKNYPLLHYLIGRSSLILGDYENALKQARLEKAQNPRLSEPYILEAETYSAMKNWTSCASTYNEVIKFSTPNAENYIKMSRCYRYAGYLDIAEKMINNATAQESGNPEVYKELGAIHETKGEKPLAVQAYQQYLVLFPNAPDRKIIEARMENLAR